MRTGGSAAQISLVMYPHHRRVVPLARHANSVRARGACSQLVIRERGRKPPRRGSRNRRHSTGFAAGYRCCGYPCCRPKPAADFAEPPDTDDSEPPRFADGRDDQRESAEI